MLFWAVWLGAFEALRLDKEVFGGFGGLEAWKNYITVSLKRERGGMEGGRGSPMRAGFP